MTTRLPFNINDYVRVRLTDFGRQRLRELHIELLGPSFPYTPPLEDEDGWSRWQLWCLMSDLGPSIHMGFNAPLMTDIEIELPDEPQSTWKPNGLWRHLVEKFFK